MKAHGFSVLGGGPWLRRLAVAAGLCLGGLTGADAQAQTEAPPVGFKGRQFVDSAGCVFLRATVSGRGLWLPLLGVDDQPICSQTPTVEVKAVATVPPVAPAVMPVAEAAVKKPAPKPAPITAAQHWIQIGAFANQANAQALHRRLIAQGWSVGQAPILGGKMIVVVVGPFARPADLRATLDRLRAAGFATAFAR